MKPTKPKAKRKLRAAIPRSRRAGGATRATKPSAPAPSATTIAPPTGNATAKRAKAGRPPVIRTKENADRICELLEEGLSLRAICEKKGMPHRDAVREWLGVDAAFAAQYARAREAQADHYAEEIVEIADRADLKPEDKRVRVDARKWVASKLKPKKYGDKVDVEHSGEVKHRIEKIERLIVDPADSNG